MILGYPHDYGNLHISNHQISGPACGRWDHRLAVCVAWDDSCSDAVNDWMYSIKEATNSNNLNSHHWQCEETKASISVHQFKKLSLGQP